MIETTSALRSAAWAFYVVLVFEILFMISPAALYFYSAYGPALNFLDRWPATAWLTQFFLPHYSTTASPVLNLLPRLGWPLLLAGLMLFLAGAVPLYWRKLRGSEPVTGGVYRVIRHPQYVGLAVMGLGTLLIWPRFLVLVGFATMLFLYGLIAGWEEAQCLAHFGESYRAYQAKTGMFVPRLTSMRLPHLLPASRAGRKLSGVAMYLAVIGALLAAMFVLRDYSLSQIYAIYRHDVAIVSPARLSDQEIDAAHRMALENAMVRRALEAARPAKQLVYVIPEAWYVPVLPIEAWRRIGPPYLPATFDHSRYKVLFARPRSHRPASAGKDIVKTAYGLDPIVVARVDIASGTVTAVEIPPPHVRWGDIPTPTF